MTLVNFTGPTVAREAAQDLERTISALAAAVGASQPFPTGALALKEVEVPLPQGVGCFPFGKPAERLSEIVNQGATLVRLRDSLAWSADEGDRLGFTATVERCHATTTGRGRAATGQADLTLSVGPERWHFEVSDVLRRNNNGKINNDCARLIQLGDARARLFLATSGVCANRGRAKKYGLEIRNGGPDASWGYTETVVMELCRW